LLLALRHFEFVPGLGDLRVQRRVVGKDIGNLLVLEDRLPRALGLANTAVDSLFGTDVELVGEGFGSITLELDNAIHRADLDTCSIHFVPAQTGDHPRHLYPSCRLRVRLAIRAFRLTFRPLRISSESQGPGSVYRTGSPPAIQEIVSGLAQLSRFYR
jgi:hypothetical protein